MLIDFFCSLFSSSVFCLLYSERDVINKRFFRSGGGNFGSIYINYIVEKISTSLGAIDAYSVHKHILTTLIHCSSSFRYRIDCTLFFYGDDLVQARCKMHIVQLYDDSSTGCIFRQLKDTRIERERSIGQFSIRYIR